MLQVKMIWEDHQAGFEREMNKFLKRLQNDKTAVKQIIWQCNEDWISALIFYDDHYIIPEEDEE